MRDVLFKIVDQNILQFLNENKFKILASSGNIDGSGYVNP